MTSELPPHSESALILKEVEAWLLKTGVAGSALGRYLLSDASLLSRWRRDGCHGVSESKRVAIVNFIRHNPNGHSALAKKNRHGPRTVSFSPGQQTVDTRFTKDYKPSAPLPTPGLSELDRQDDIEWVRMRANATGMPIVRVLADMCQLGIRFTQELEREERLSNDGEGSDDGTSRAVSR